MVPFVQNTGIALLAKTTIAQVRPIHSLIGLNKDMRVWEQINTSNVLNPPTPDPTAPPPQTTPCDQPLNITWWPFDGLDPAGDPNRKTIPILLSHLLHRDGTKFECSLSCFAFLWHILILSSDHDDYCHDRGQGSPHHDIGEKCTCSAGRGAGPASLDPHHTTRIRARALSCNMYVCKPFQRLAFTSNAQSSSNLSNILLFFLSFL